MKEFKSGQDYLTYYMNHFLSTDTGKQILKDSLGDDHDTSKLIKQQLDVHAKIMEAGKSIPAPNQQLALGTQEQPLIPGSSPYPQGAPSNPQPLEHLMPDQALLPRAFRG